MTTTPAKFTRLEFEGSYQYRAIVTHNGKQIIDTVFSDFFADDAAAIAGFTQIMQEAGKTVLSVTIGEITVVDVA